MDKEQVALLMIAWLKNREHLPQPLKDFHDQKDVFKTIGGMKMRDDDDEDAEEAVNWIEGQCYVIDKFLLFMAQHGYTLQRARTKKVSFLDLNETIRKRKDVEAEAFRQFLAEEKAKRGTGTD